ncbi:SH3 domain-containing protein [uncultured Litoreibacter sp.]|uniref:SH3 domain-containing protein n=1 Tax=uncultured Litoreibacter sp. TaxID=1392394 RepID=UPI002620D43A|nr:SH3 domain-containing protein [uncultured Litoreibacter sp.]
MTQVGYTAIGCGWAKRARTLTLSAAVLIAAPFSSLAESVPVLAQVTGVAANDTLNVRAGPSGSDAIIGELKPSEKVELVEISPDGGWARLLWKEGNGWVSRRFVSDIQRKRLASGLPADLSCIGNEPFWSLNINANSSVGFEIAGEDRQSYPLAWSTSSQNNGDGGYAFGTGDMDGVLRREICSDGMSDRDYGWSVDVILRGQAPQLLSGCCITNVSQ